MVESQPDLRRVRIVAAVLLAVGSASVGFLGGWLSAGHMPMATHPVAAQDGAPRAKLARPLAPAKVEVPGQNADAPGQNEATASVNGAGAHALEGQAVEAPRQPAASVPQTASEPRTVDETKVDDSKTAAAAHDKQAAAVQDEQKVPETHAGATIINAGAASKPSASRNAPASPATEAPNSNVAADRSPDRSDADVAPGRSADQETLERCARRYASFRASDGTYQPYDGGTRKLCSLLR